MTIILLRNLPHNHITNYWNRNAFSVPWKVSDTTLVFPNCIERWEGGGYPQTGGPLRGGNSILTNLIALRLDGKVTLTSRFNILCIKSWRCINRSWRSRAFIFYLQIYWHQRSCLFLFIRLNSTELTTKLTIFKIINISLLNYLSCSPTKPLLIFYWQHEYTTNQFALKCLFQLNVIGKV